MAEINYIKHLYEIEGKSLRAIARETGIDFRTVQKYVRMDNFNVERLPKAKAENHPILGPYIATINEWLEQDVKEPRNQRHTIQQIHKRLQRELGFKGSYSCVKRYVNKKKFLMKSKQDGFLPLAQPIAHAQIDFGKFKYYDEFGIGQKGYYLVITFPYSNTGWIQVFPSENQECLLEGMKRIFAHIGGVPVKIKADNMSTAVAQILSSKGDSPKSFGSVSGSKEHITTQNSKGRILTDGFIRFKLHYRFEAEFCNPGSAHEKGNVENKVGYTRRNMLVPVPTIDDFEAFNEELLIRCDNDHNRIHYRHGVLISELWQEEKKHLLTLPPHEYHVFRYETLRVNKYGFVTIDTNKYGLSPAFSRKTVQAKIYHNKVELYHDHALLKTFARSYGKNKEVMDWKQYIPTLIHKPGAIEHTRFYNQIPKLWQEHLRQTQGKERKTALMVLNEIIGDGNEEFCDEVLSFARECGRTDADSIRQCYYIVCKMENHPKPVVLDLDIPTINYQPSLLVYDGLMGGLNRLADDGINALTDSSNNVLANSSNKVLANSSNKVLANSSNKVLANSSNKVLANSTNNVLANSTNNVLNSCDKGVAVNE